MKKLLSAFVLTAICTSAFAQVSITSNNYYKPGNTARDIYTVENDERDSVSTANVLTTPLTFSNSLESIYGVYGLVDTVFYAEPATEGEFIEETCSFADGNGMRMHLKVTDEKAVCLGVSGALTQLGLNDDIEIEFDDPMDVINFPAEINSQVNSTAHGLYLENISALQGTFNNMSSYGSMIYSFVSAEYDSIMVDIQVTYASTFDETGTLTLSGSRMMQGDYEYLRENRQHSYITNLYMQRIGAQEFTIISECTLTNPMVQTFFGSETINLGEALESFMGMSFPMTSTSISLNYWRTDDNYPIVEIATNANLDYSKHLAIRYEDHETSCTVLENAKVKIYPNPTIDFFNIETEDLSKGTIRIYSVNGSLVKEESLEGSYNSINVNALQSGNYFFRISCGDKEINGKFAKN